MSFTPFTSNFLESQRQMLIYRQIEIRQELQEPVIQDEVHGDLVDRHVISSLNREITDRTSKYMKELAEIDAALTRIAQNTYGICEITGTPIGEERLQAIPTARFDVQGQRRTESIQKKLEFIRRFESYSVEQEAS